MMGAISVEPEGACAAAASSMEMKNLTCADGSVKGIFVLPALRK